MKYPTAFVVTTQPPSPKESTPRWTSPDRCDRCMAVLVSRTTIDSLQTSKREDEGGNATGNSWSFYDTQGRTSCNCVKVVYTVDMCSVNGPRYHCSLYIVCGSVSAGSLTCTQISLWLSVLFQASLYVYMLLNFVRLIQIADIASFQMN